jgi:hypothetical protein
MKIVSLIEKCINAGDSLLQIVEFVAALHADQCILQSIHGVLYTVF